MSNIITTAKYFHFLQMLPEQTLQAFRFTHTQYFDTALSGANEFSRTPYRNF